MQRRLWPLAALAIVLALAALAYSPGLAGGFLFDDFVNLDALGSSGRVDDWPTFWRYLTSGTADPLGRPLALLTFLLDARDWPADPFPFLRTNLAIHLINAGLLFALLRQLERRLAAGGSENDWVPVLASAAWVLHPLFVSTTLYIVQREAMLPATFTLLGLLAYFHGSALADAGRTRAALAWMVAGIAGGTLLAALCKANGVLLPLLAWVLDANTARTREANESGESKPLLAARLALLVVPSLALGVWLLSRLHDLGAVVPGRDWSLAQRLMTEPRVLVEYLGLLAIPRAISTGLYNDAYVPSSGILHPWTTLLCLATVLFLVAGAFAWRKHAPRLAAAVLFFFCAHVLESSVIPLELYFEHRNYLPALLLGWPLASACLAAGPRLRLRRLAGGAWLLLLAVVLFQRASLWGNQDALYEAWAQIVPNSPRALATSAMTQAKRGDVEGAKRMLDRSWRRHPAQLQLALNYIDMSCRGAGIDSLDAGRVDATLRSATQGESLLVQWLSKAVWAAGQGACPGLTLEVAGEWIDISERNPRLIPPALAPTLAEPLRGQLAIARGDREGALRHFDVALAARPEPSVAAGQAALLASAGFYAQALSQLDHYDAMARSAKHNGPRPGGMPGVHAWVLERQSYWPTELADLRRRLIVAQQGASPP